VILSAAVGALVGAGASAKQTAEPANISSTASKSAGASGAFPEVTIRAQRPGLASLVSEFVDHITSRLPRTVVMEDSCDG
jgi:hypothetical protein